jgi:hypothetical protein
MASDIAKTLIGAHFDALFPPTGDVVVKALRNLEDPEPPRTIAEIDGKTYLFLQFPPHQERASCFGGGEIPWRETGVVILHVLVASGRRDAEADAVFRAATNSLRNQTIGGRVDIRAMFGADSGPRFGGNWWGKSIAVEYEIEDIGTA